MPYCQKCGSELPAGALYCPMCGAAVEVPPAAPVALAAPAPEMKLAYWWERFAAWLIDVVIVAFALAIVSLFTFLLGQPLNAFTTFGAPWWVTIFVSFSVDSIILFVYWTFMDGAYGQSFGKMVMRIQLARLDGSRVDMGRAAISSVGKSFFLFWDVLLGWFLYPRRRQRVFNYLSETVVTKVT
ncbi:MAG: RDD family protein [Candidatus Bathyarchaeota archaeon]|nr:RDD family protein [Candidatus Bathyarchaeota archaeon]